MHAFGTVVHVQRKCERKNEKDMAKHSLKEFKDLLRSVVVSQEGHALSLLC